MNRAGLRAFSRAKAHIRESKADEASVKGAIQRAFADLIRIERYLRGLEITMSDDFMLDTDDLHRRMDGAMANLKTEFASLRTGRASGSMLEPVMVDAYGSMTPINQVGTVNVPEPRMVTINVWDKGLVQKVEKAIRESGLGINPQLNGTIIMLPIPELNEERRRELTKVAAQYTESARVSVRNVRRDGMDQIKKAKNDGLSEDDQKFWEAEVQELTDAAIKAVDAALEVKQEEIMQV
jgi:ribosome recycling factor